MIFGSHKKIVYVEDDINTRKSAVLVLEGWGIKVVEAVDSADALDKIPSEKPDLILLDINIPGIGGYEVCKILKQNEHTFKIPIILITGLGKTKDVDKGYECGADDYVVKPVNWDMLRTKISKYIKI